GQGLPHTHTPHKRLFPTRSTDPSPNWKPQHKTGRKQKAGKEGRGSQTQAAYTAFRILQHLFNTLSSPSTPQHWHNHPRQQLLNGLQHRIQRLQHCLPHNVTLFPQQGPRNPLLTINKYFRHIHHFLRAHNHSACAWDHVRLEARLCFQHVHNLTRTARS
uniref:Uncharacterized protein n=1 Tax=Melopsittacus undulatus TaxID=13146 RepID=A0A8V5GGN2_MELUD